ncbi:IS701 family transposase [Streptomyces sp. NPDC093228]|uniref:IS701 family transposase n=1 Tax=Streptomyces sp. NPDC093228 TaxID=3155070 RepID=UPI003446CC57
MLLREIDQQQREISRFVDEVFASIPRRDTREWADCYLRGLLLDGDRKTVQRMAERLPGADVQALQQFVNQSSWDHLAVLHTLALRTTAGLDPDVWSLTDIPFLKTGRLTAGVARQWCEPLKRQANCQIAVVLNAVSSDASTPISWRLFLPAEWDSDPSRRRQAGIPDEIRHAERWMLALELLDQAVGWGLKPKTVVADSNYGRSAQFRRALHDRGLDFVLSVPPKMFAEPEAAPPTEGDDPNASRPHTTNARPADANYQWLPWNQGSDFPRSRFRAYPPQPATSATKKPLPPRGGSSPETTVLAEWPPGTRSATASWITNLSVDTPLQRLVDLAKADCRVQGDHQEIQTRLGLDHFQGRSWRGWHHHVTLVTAAHAYLTLRGLQAQSAARATCHVLR